MSTRTGCPLWSGCAGASSASLAENGVDSQRSGTLVACVHDEPPCAYVNRNPRGGYFTVSLARGSVFRFNQVQNLLLQSLELWLMTPLE
jgi:hypothetical protein